MNNISNEDFISWYKSTDINPDPALIPIRIESIKQTLKLKRLDFWLDLVRVFIGVPPKEQANIDKFLEKFPNGDNVLTIKNNENLIRCLVSITICYKLDSPDPNFNNTISLAIINSNFLGQYQIYNTVPVIGFAKQNLLSYALMEREIHNDETLENLDQLKETVKATDTISKDIINSIINELNSLTMSNKSLAEESNVLWWIFGGYSEICDSAFSEIGYHKAIIVSAKELAEKTTYSQCFAAANQILNKVIHLSIKGKEKLKETTLIEVINSVTPEISNKIMEKSNLITSEFTPCLAALKKSIEQNQNEDWSSTYSIQNFNADVKKQFTPMDLSTQFYREFIYLRNF